MTITTRPATSTRLVTLATLVAAAEDAGVEVLSACAERLELTVVAMGRPIVVFQRLRPFLSDLGPIVEYGPRNEAPRFKMDARLEGLPITLYVSGRD